MTRVRRLLKAFSIAAYLVWNTQVIDMYTHTEYSNAYTFVLAFLENLNIKSKNILEYIRTMFVGNIWLFSETTDSELL